MFKLAILIGIGLFFILFVISFFIFSKDSFWWVSLICLAICLIVIIPFLQSCFVTDIKNNEKYWETKTEIQQEISLQKVLYFRNYEEKYILDYSDDTFIFYIDDEEKFRGEFDLSQCDQVEIKTDDVDSGIISVFNKTSTTDSTLYNKPWYVLDSDLKIVETLKEASKFSKKIEDITIVEFTVPKNTLICVKNENGESTYFTIAELDSLREIKK